MSISRATYLSHTADFISVVITKLSQKPWHFIVCRIGNDLYSAGTRRSTAGSSKQAASDRQKKRIFPANL